jgi:hypothetical protein
MKYFAGYYWKLTELILRSVLGTYRDQSEHLWTKCIIALSLKVPLQHDFDIV